MESWQTVRLCTPKYDDLYQVHADGRSSGPLAKIAEAGREMIRGLNTSRFLYAKVGRLLDRETMRYDGCLGSMQRNESDVMVFAYLDVPVPGPNLAQGVVDGFERVGIMSAFRNSDASNATRTHVMDMFYAFSADLWLLTLVSLIFLSLILRKSLQVNRRSRVAWKRTFDAVEACVLNQHSGCMSLMPDICSVLFVYFLMSVFAFLVAFYLTSMIKTDMVVIPPPLTIQTYDELLQSGRRPLWATILRDWDQFKHAARGSKQRQIWQMAERMDVNKSLVPTSMAAVVSNAMAIGRQESVFMLKRFLGLAIVPRVACAYKTSTGTLPDVNPLFAHDESARESLQGRVYNPLMDAAVAQYINHRVQLSFEAHLRPAAQKFADFRSVMGENMYDKHSEIEECASNVVTVPHAEYQPVNVMHYVSLFWITTPFLAFACLILLFEHFLK